jgi:predicted membrane-bound mannosyltransferase
VLRPGFAWAITAGVAAGFLYATKETSIFIFAAAGGGILVAWLTGKMRPPTLPAGGPQAPARPAIFAQLAAAAAAALSVAFLFFSSLFRNPKGIVDSLAAFKDYFVRGTESGVHTQPWFTYLKTLLWTKTEGIVWSEALILGLALIGIGAAFLHRKRGAEAPADSGPAGQSATGFWPVYLAAATLVLTAVYSVLPYKTPWNMVVFLAGFAILAGYGAAALMRSIRPSAGRAVIIVFILAGAAQLEQQNLRAQFVYPADPRNPYVYAQTSPDFLRLVERLRGLADAHSHGREMLIKVIAESYEQWPLPWYLRDFRRVGYWTSLAEAGGIEGVPVTIASQRYAEIIERAAGDAFEIEYYGLRPGTLLTVFIDHSLWEAFLKGRSER